MSEKPLPKAFLFDVFGTVVDWRGSMIREVSAAMGRAGASLDTAAFVDAWRGLYQPSMEAVRSGARPWTILDTLHRESLDALLGQYGVAAHFDAPARQALTRAWTRLDPWPDAVDGVAALRRIGFVASCSNGDIALMAHLARHAGLSWDAILGAEPNRDYKPKPAVYLGSCAQLYLPPHEVMMVAAHASDLAAARAQGLQTAFVARPHEFGPNGALDPADAAGWDVSVQSIGAVARALSG